MKYNEMNKIEFREVVLGHFGEILKITSSELRDSSRTTLNSAGLAETYDEDTRVSFFQSVEFLSYCLQPHFNESIQAIHDESIKIMNSYDFEILESKKKEFEEIKSKVNSDGIEEYFCIKTKLMAGKKLFSELNKLLKKLDYLKGGDGFSDSEEESVE